MLSSRPGDTRVLKLSMFENLSIVLASALKHLLSRNTEYKKSFNSSLDELEFIVDRIVVE